MNRSAQMYSSWSNIFYLKKNEHFEMQSSTNPPPPPPKSGEVVGGSTFICLWNMETGDLVVIRYCACAGEAWCVKRRRLEVCPQTPHAVHRSQRQDQGGSTVCFWGAGGKGIWCSCTLCLLLWILFVLCLLFFCFCFFSAVGTMLENQVLSSSSGMAVFM